LRANTRRFGARHRTRQQEALRRFSIPIAAGFQLDSVHASATSWR